MAVGRGYFRGSAVFAERDCDDHCSSGVRAAAAAALRLGLAMSGKIVMGMSCSVASTILTNIGILFQKYSADVEKGRPLCKRWRFWLGFALNLGSEAGLTTVALALAPLSFIAPLAGLAVVFNALIARAGFVPGIREKMAFADWLATLCIVVGVTLVAISGPQGTPAADGGADPNRIASLPAALRQPAFIAYAACASATVAAWLFLWKQRCSQRLRRLAPREDSTMAAIGSSLSAALTSAFSVIFLKVIALAVGELASEGIAPTAVVYSSIVCILITAPLQLYLLNMTLASGKATFTIPLYLSLTMLLTSASGAILFDEFSAVARRHPRPLWLVVYGCGFFIVLVALAFLSSRQEVKARRAMALSNQGAVAAPINGPGRQDGVESAVLVVTATDRPQRHVLASDAHKAADRRGAAKVHPEPGAPQDSAPAAVHQSGGRDRFAPALLGSSRSGPYAHKV